MSHCAQCIVDISYIFWTLLIDAVPLGSGIRISSFWIECPTVRNASLTFHVFLELCWNARAHGDLLSLALTFPGLLWLSWNARAHGVLWLYLSCFDLAGALVGPLSCFSPPGEVDKETQGNTLTHCLEKRMHFWASLAFAKDSRGFVDEAAMLGT